MRHSLNAIVFMENGWHIAQCIEVDVATQGNSADEACDNLREAMILHFRAPSSTFEFPFATSVDEALEKHPTAGMYFLEVLSD